LTGDVGRGCGDASRALLFSAERAGILKPDPTFDPTFNIAIAVPVSSRKHLGPSMPLRRPRLPFDPVFRKPFGTIAMERVEAAYGIPIPDDLRARIVALTQAMCWQSEAWQSGLPIAEVQKQITDGLNVTLAWLRWEDSLPAKIEVMTEAEAETKIAAMERVRTMVMQAATSTLTDDADLDTSVFMRRLVVACEEWLAALASMEDRQHPWEVWITKLIAALEDFGYEVAARNDGGAPDGDDEGIPKPFVPSPFVALVDELQQQIKEKYRQHTHSKAALAGGINRTRRKSAKFGDDRVT
jgi:hypothetical protein